MIQPLEFCLSVGQAWVSDGPTYGSEFCHSLSMWLWGKWLSTSKVVLLFYKIKILIGSTIYLCSRPCIRVNCMLLAWFWCILALRVKVSCCYHYLLFLFSQSVKILFCILFFQFMVVFISPRAILHFCIISGGFLTITQHSGTGRDLSTQSAEQKVECMGWCVCVCVLISCISILSFQTVLPCESWYTYIYI